jgi:hypothetical protein
LRRKSVRTFTLCFYVNAICSLICLTNSSISAQTRSGAPVARQTSTPVQQPATSVDEDFELNIAERRINETDFQAETAVEAGGEAARGLNLKVGVAVGAREIDVLLRNVRGHVRFRATLEPVLRLLDARRDRRPATTSAPRDDSP